MHCISQYRVESVDCLIEKTNYAEILMNLKSITFLPLQNLQKLRFNFLYPNSLFALRQEYRNKMGTLANIESDLLQGGAKVVGQCFF